MMLCTGDFGEHQEEKHIKDIKEAGNVEGTLNKIFLNIIQSSDNLDNMTVQLIKRSSSILF